MIMNRLVEFDYFYGAEAEQFSFIRLPKLLFTDRHFRSLSFEAKVVYGMEKFLGFIKSYEDCKNEDDALSA